MNTAIKSEEEDNLRLRRANEFIRASQEAETQARIALTRAVEQTKLARAKYNELFAACEARACARRQAGLIAVNPGY